MIVFAKSILKDRPGATLVGEVKCSQVMYDEIARLGGVPVMWKTGHSLIKARMKELKAAMAGEMSGHIFFADKWFGFDDAVYSSCRVLEIVANERVKDEGFAFSSMLSGIAETVVTPDIRRYAEEGRLVLLGEKDSWEEYKYEVRQYGGGRHLVLITGDKGEVWGGE